MIGALVLLFGLAWLTPGPAPLAADEAYRVMVSRIDSSQFPDVQFTVTVLDHQYVPVSDLRPGDFQLFEDGERIQAVKQVSRVNAAESPISVLMVIDSNLTMDGRPMRDVREAVADFVFSLGPKDTAAAYTFGGTVRPVQGFTTDKQALAAQVRQIRANGNPVLYDAVWEAIDVANREKNPRKVIVLLSDGKDTSSIRELSDVIGKATAAKVPIFGLGLGEEVNRDALRKLADVSGGVALFAPTSTDVLGAYQTMANHLRSEYSVAFRSSLKADGKQHKLTVAPRVPDAKPSSEVQFTATQNPPTVELIVPQVNAELKPMQEIEIKAQGIAPITKVEFTAQGKVLGTVTSAPWRVEWNTEEMAPGQATLNVKVYDAVENQVAKFYPFVIKNTKDKRDTAMAAPSGPLQRSNSNDESPFSPLVIGLALGVPALVGAGFAGRKQVLKRMPLRCSTHKVNYTRGSVCPQCAAEAAKTLDHRLRRFAEGSDSVAAD